MSLRTAALLTLFLSSAACSRALDSPELGLRYEAPGGMSHRGTLQEGGRWVARFDGGLDIIALSDLGLPTQDLAPEALIAALQRAGLVSAGSRVVSSKAGSIPAGPVLRAALSDGDERTLLYVLLRPGSPVLFRLTGSGAEHERQSRRFERSLASIRLS